MGKKEREVTALAEAREEAKVRIATAREVAFEFEIQSLSKLQKTSSSTSSHCQEKKQ